MSSLVLRLILEVKVNGRVSVNFWREGGIGLADDDLSLLANQCRFILQHHNESCHRAFLWLGKPLSTEVFGN